MSSARKAQLAFALQESMRQALAVPEFSPEHKPAQNCPKLQHWLRMISRKVPARHRRRVPFGVSRGIWSRR
jgi:hypothetical protein